MYQNALIYEAPGFRVLSGPACLSLVIALRTLLSLVISSEARNLESPSKISQSPASRIRSRQGAFEMTSHASIS